MRGLGDHKHVLRAALALTLLAGSLHAQNQVVARTRIELAGDKVVVPVTLGKSRLRLILDTGMSSDGILLFHRTRIDMMQFRDLEEVILRGAGAEGVTSGWRGQAMSLSIGEKKLDDESVTVLRTDIYKDVVHDGVIGHSLFGRYVVEIDRDRRTMTLYEPGTFCAEAAWKSIDIYFSHNRIPWTDIRVDSEPATLAAYIDVGSAESLELLTRDVNRFDPPRKGRRRLSGRGLGGDVRGHESHVDRVHLGPFVIEDVDAFVVPAHVRSRQDGADAIIGSGLLSRFNVIFDYARRKIHLRPRK